MLNQCRMVQFASKSMQDVAICFKINCYNYLSSLRGAFFSQTKLRLGGTTESKDFSEIVAKVGNKEFKPKFGLNDGNDGVWAPL